MRTLIVLLLGGLLVYAVVIATLFLAQRLLVFPSYAVDAEMAGHPLDGFEIVEVRTADDEILRAFWRPPAAGGPVVVSFHGNADHPRTHAVRFSEPAWVGYGVLAVAFRGYPGSTGSTSENGLLLDGEAAIAWAEGAAPGSSLVLHGHSLGTTVAVAMSERHASKGLLLEAPILSMVGMVSYRVPFAPGFLVRDPLRSDLRIGSSKACRILVVHGDLDATVPIEFGRRLAQLSERAVFRPMPGHGHGSIVGAADEWFVEQLRGHCPQAALAV